MKAVVAIVSGLFLCGLCRAQEAVPPRELPDRPVLRALPIGGDEDPLSRPLEDAAPSAAPAELPQVSAPQPPPLPVASPSDARPAVLPAEAVPTPAPAVAPAPEPEEKTPVPAEPQDGPLDGKPEGDNALRLQVFLDEANFGPGVIDGKAGRFTELAVRSWNEVNGHPPDDWVAVNAAARKAVPNPLANAVVPAAAKSWVDASLPSSKALQAKRKRMGYRSYAEFMAERYHCDVPFLVRINGAKKTYGVRPGGTLMVPNVTAFRIEKLTGARHEADAALSARHVVVDTRINQARIFEAAPAAVPVEEGDGGAAVAGIRPNRGLIASFPITPGKPRFIRIGTWELRNMVELPVWRYDPQLLNSGKRGTYSLNIPAGPNNPVGVIWNGLSRPGIGMHGTSDPETIGRARSAGCIRLANWDAVRLPQLVRPGTTVEIR